MDIDCFKFHSISQSLWGLRCSHKGKWFYIFYDKESVFHRTSVKLEKRKLTLLLTLQVNSGFKSFSTTQKKRMSWYANIPRVADQWNLDKSWFRWQIKPQHCSIKPIVLYQIVIIGHFLNRKRQLLCCKQDVFNKFVCNFLLIKKNDNIAQEWQSQIIKHGILHPLVGMSLIRRWNRSHAGFLG